jgi:glycosyltransferase involved in cell wall biosynthesis
MFRTIERRLARSTTRLVAVSPEVRDDLVALGVAAPERFSVIRLGIPLDSRVTSTAESRGRLRALFGVPEERFVVGWIGRMTAVKRTDVVLRGFRRLKDEGIDAALCMVGDGPDRGSVEELARELGIMRECLFPGYQEDVGRFFSAFDVFVLPSGNEGTPVTAIEALASGCPVVATRVGGVPDVVTDGVDGFLVAPAAVDELAARLAELARDPGLRARMGGAGQERMRTRYAVDRLIDDIDRLYRDLLEQKGIATGSRRRLDGAGQ